MAKKAVAAKPHKSEIEISYCEQGTDEWRQLRAGMITASNFSVVLRDAEAKTRTKLLHKLAGEIISGEIANDDFKSEAMARGNAWEPMARQAYSEARDVEVDQVGFVSNFKGLKRCGSSPDGFVGFDGGLEIKVCSPVVLIPMLDRGAILPSAFRAQVHGNIWICERDWWDLSVFWPNMPRFIVRVHRDESTIKELSDGVERFNYDLGQLVDRLKKMGAR